MWETIGQVIYLIVGGRGLGKEESPMIRQWRSTSVIKFISQILSQDLNPSSPISPGAAVVNLFCKLYTNIDKY